MVEAASFEGPLLPWSSTPSARGRSFELSLMTGEIVAAVPNLLGEARAASCRPATELAGLFEAFADSMMIGIFYEQLEAVRTRTYDGPGGLRRAGRVCGEREGAVWDGPAGSASGQHEHGMISLHMLRAPDTADQCMIRGSSKSRRAAPHDAVPCHAMPCDARACESERGQRRLEASS